MKITCMIWYMRRQPKISGLRLGWCCCMIRYIIDDKCVKSCMILYDIWESNPKNFGITAWLLLFSVIYEKCSCLFLAFLTPQLSLSSQTRYKSYKKNLKIETEAYQIMCHLCKICNHFSPPLFQPFLLSSHPSRNYMAPSLNPLCPYTHLKSFFARSLSL